MVVAVVVTTVVFTTVVGTALVVVIAAVRLAVCLYLVGRALVIRLTKFPTVWNADRIALKTFSKAAVMAPNASSAHFFSSITPGANDGMTCLVTKSVTNVERISPTGTFKLNSKLNFKFNVRCQF